MIRPHFGYAAVSAFLLALVTAAPLAADPPGRVARLSYYRGSVSFRPASLDEWGPVTVNYPLTTGDRLWTDQDATAEMHIGSAVVRLAPYTAFAFLNLDDLAVQARLSEGTADIVVRRLERGEQFEVDTPASAVTLVLPGIYHIEVDPDGNTTRVTVRRGEAEVFSDRSEFRVYAGQTGVIASGADGEMSDVDRAAAPDGWERWCRTRDEREANSASLRYVSDEMIGYEDLDEYGTWSSVSDYGYVWRPRTVMAGWAPYRDGHWAWIEPWGWTWVDDAPWGFAPFHYGRWACQRGDWFWVPGAWMRRPVYAPALVAFIGGDNWGVSIGFGGRRAIGWFPLGPHEPYIPAFRAGYGYVRSVNVAHVNITNINVTNIIYANRSVAGAVTAVPHDSFARARSLRQVAVPVSGDAVSRAELLGTAAPVAPRAESILGRGGVAIPRRAQAALDRPVVARSTPPPAVAPFAARERALQATAGRPLDDRTATLRQGTSDGLPVRQVGARTRGAAVVQPGGSDRAPTGATRPAEVRRPAATEGQAPPAGGEARPRYAERRPTGDSTRPAQVERPAPPQETTAPSRSRVMERRQSVENTRPPQVERPAPQTPPQETTAPSRSRAFERRPPTENTRPPQVERPAPQTPPQVERPPQAERPTRARPEGEPPPPRSSDAGARAQAPERPAPRDSARQAPPPPRDPDKPAQAARPRRIGG
jgi:hypothetical protein